MPDGASELLKISLSAAVPLHIAEMKSLPWAEVSRIASEASQFIAEHGDALMYKTKGVTAKAFNHLAKGLAALSFVPGGVKFLGMHFEARHEGGESAVAAAGRPRNLTFEKGTYGRLALKRGLSLEAEQVEANPNMPADDPWQGMADHWRIRLVDRDGREFVQHVSFGKALKAEPELDAALRVAAVDALDAEESRGDPARYADLTGADPEDPATAEVVRSLVDHARRLRDFLGDAAYRELLEIAAAER